MFQREPNVVVIERSDPCVHREAEMLVAGNRQDTDRGVPCHQFNRRQVNLVDDVHRTGQKGVLPRDRIRNGEQ